MPIPPELHSLIAQARQKMPQLADPSDEQVAQMLMQAMQEQQSTTEVETAEITDVIADECNTYGEQLLNTGQWQEAERYFFAAIEKAEQENDLYINT